MTPTEQDKKFFAEHHEFFERLWKPAFGDLVLLWDGDKAQWGKDLWCVIGRFSEDAVDVIRESDGAIGAALIVDCALLARQGQLQVMLEERGLKGGTWKVGRMSLPEKNAYLLAGCEVSDADEYIALCSQLPPRKPFFGPTPSIALGKCLLDMLKEE